MIRSPFYPDEYSDSHPKDENIIHLKNLWYVWQIRAWLWLHTVIDQSSTSSQKHSVFEYHKGKFFYGNLLMLQYVNSIGAVAKIGRKDYLWVDTKYIHDQLLSFKLG